MTKYEDIPGVTRTRCTTCKRPLLVVQPTLQVLLGIPPPANPTCDDCEANEVQS
jgi:hypothetical protein